MDKGSNLKIKLKRFFTSRRLLTPFIFILIVGVLSIPVFIVGMNYGVEYVHGVQSTLSKDVGDMEVIENMKPSPVTFGLVDKPKVVGGQHFGIIRCEKIDLECSVFYGVNRVTLRSGAAAVNSYSLPGFGETTLVTGYNSTCFKNLHKLQKGDLISFSTSWGLFDYRVTDTEVMTQEDAIDFRELDREILVLFCNYPNEPFAHYGDQRYYVICEKASGPAVEVNGDG